MKLKHITFFIPILLFLTSCELMTEQSEASRFEGLWRLHIIEIQDSVTKGWHEYGDGLQGYILYDGKDNMAVHLTTKGYQDTDILFDDFNESVSIAELKHRTGSYVYFAKYSVDEENKIVTHARISHSNPNLWDITVMRSYKFTGDTLELTTLERGNSPLRVKWIPY